MNEEYYKQQIRGLILILESNEDKDPSVSRGYVKEKLNMILSGGIGFHPSIAKKIGLELTDEDKAQLEGFEEV